MGYTLYDLDMTDANNTSFAGISQAENSMRAPAVNNAFRALDGALARFIADGGGTVTTGGSANAQTVTLNQAIATTVPTGFFFTVKFGYTNTSTTVTLNVNSIGAKSVKVNFGGVLSDPIPGDMRAGAYGHFIYDGTYMVLLNAQQQARYAPGTLYGLTLSNNASDATNDIDIAVGSCRSSDDSANIDLLSALTKRLDASWAVGSGNGGLDTGSIANGTYHVWLIKRSDTGVVDALFSTSATAPTMPTNYDLKRRIGSIIRASSAIRSFKQVGDTFYWLSGIADRNSTSAASAALLTLSVPTGIVVAPLLSLSLATNSTSRVRNSLGSAAAGGTTADVQDNGSNQFSDSLPSPMFFTNTSAQLYFAATVDAGSAAANILYTLGYVDTRGRL